MYSIGEFSRITGLTIKALRLYHENELLIPSRVDEFSGYRYYGEVEVEKARMIVYLRSLEFSLNEIRDLLENFEDESEIIGFLEKRKSALEKKIRQFRNITFSLDVIIQKEKEMQMALKIESFQIEEKPLPDILIAGICHHGRYEECGKLFGKIARAMGRHIDGKPFNLYYDNEYKEIADFESCFPVKREKQADGIEIRKLSGGKCVSLIHKGPYKELNHSYKKVFDYIKDKNYSVSLPSREIYLKGPGMILKGKPQNYLTEIQMLVEE